MNNKTIRVGVIGAGANTRAHHIPKLQQLPGVEVAGVANRSRESSLRVAHEFGLTRIYESWHEVIEDDSLDAVVIGTWPYLHCAATLAALGAGKHVLCEARMAMNAAEARQMRDAARQRPKLVAQIVPSPFTLHVDKTIQRLLDDGYIGDVLAIEVRAGGTFLDAEAPLTWRQDYALSGLNIMSMGIWYEALMRWVGEATQVMAMGKVFVPLRRDATGNKRAVRVPEHVDVLAEMACGAQLRMQISAVAGLAGGPEAWIFGSDGTLRFADGKLFGGQKGADKLSEIGVAPGLEGGWRVEEEFVNAIRGREVISHTTCDDGVKYMEFTEAVARSMAGRRSVALPLALNG
jgi:predicted dehydrogenase